MIKQNVFIGIARCPKTDKVYGVRLEEKTSNRWTATWAFSIKEETAQREGYTQNQFPTDLNYEADYSYNFSHSRLGKSKSWKLRYHYE